MRGDYLRAVEVIIRCNINTVTIIFLLQVYRCNYSTNNYDIFTHVHAHVVSMYTCIMQVPITNNTLTHTHACVLTRRSRLRSTPSCPRGSAAAPCAVAPCGQTSTSYHQRVGPETRRHIDYYRWLTLECVQ